VCEDFCLQLLHVGFCMMGGNDARVLLLSVILSLGETSASGSSYSSSCFLRFLERDFESEVGATRCITVWWELGKEGGGVRSGAGGEVPAVEGSTWDGYWGRVGHLLVASKGSG
jgi:hypothetical protein